MHTDFTVQVMMDASRRIAELQTSTERNLGALASEFRLFRQETQFYRAGILKRLETLEKSAAKPIIDWQPIIHNLWFKIALLAALASGNTQAIDMVRAIFQN